MRAAGERPGGPAQRLRRPAVSLREYGGVTCPGRQAAYGDGFVLPESYRHPFKRRLRNVAFAEWAPRFVRQPRRPAAALLTGRLPARHLRPRPLRARAHRAGGPPVGLARPGADTRTCGRWSSPTWQGPGDVGVGPARLPAGDRSLASVVAHRTDRRRAAGHLVADVRDAGLRAPGDRADVRRRGRGLARGRLRRGRYAAAVLLAPAGQALVPQRQRGRGALRGARLHGRLPRGPPPARPGADGARADVVAGSRAAGCSRSPSPAGPST